MALGCIYQDNGIAGGWTFSNNSPIGNNTLNPPVDYYGEWFDITLPVEINLSSYNFSTQGIVLRNPRSWRLYAFSNNTWNLIDNRIDQDISLANTTYSYNVNTSAYYSRYAFIINNIMHFVLNGTGATSVSMNGFRLMGKEKANVNVGGEMVAHTLKCPQMTYLQNVYSADGTNPILFWNDVRFLGNMYGAWISCANVRTYGAVGDGVADDTLAFNQAITDMNAKGGGLIYIPAGTYLTTGISINVPNSIHLLGEGRDVCVIKRSPNNGLHVISFDKSYGSSVRGLTIDGNRGVGTGTGHGIRIQEAVDLAIEDFSVKNTIGYGLGFQDTTNYYYDKHSIRICNGVLRNIGDDGIDFKNRHDNTYNVIIDNIEVDGWSINNVDAKNAIDIRGSGFRINNLYIKFAQGIQGTGVHVRDGELEASNGLGGHKTLISNTYVYGTQSPGQTGMAILGRNCSINNSIVENLNTGIALYNRECIVNSVQFLSCDTGITTSTYSETDVAVGCIVSSCVFNSGNAATPLGTALLLTQHDAIINNSIIKNHNIGVHVVNGATLSNINVSGLIYSNTLSNLVMI
jgi:hypothetical protein